MIKKIQILRSKFKKYDIDGYVVPKNDDFFTEYSNTTPSEHMAEVYSHMVSHKDIVEFKTNKDPILKKKVEFIKKNILKIDKDFEF